jgi:hypothetical protein
MSKQALNYQLGQLETLGYLARLDDPEDRLSQRVSSSSAPYCRGSPPWSQVEDLSHFCRWPEGRIMRNPEPKTTS